MQAPDLVPAVPTAVACSKLYTSQDKWTVSVFAGLLAAFIFAPFLFKLTNRLTKSMGFQVADADGCPNITGLILHGIVFALVIRVLMR